MKILHTSDWHLGKNDGDTSLYADQVFFIDEICRVVAEEKIDAVLIAGDVYDNSKLSAAASSLYSYAMQKLCDECGATVFVIAGNHDGVAHLSNCSGLLRRAGLNICGEICGDVTPVRIKDCEIFLLPWITEEKVKSVFPEQKENIKELEDAYRTVTEKMREHFTPGLRHIVLSHAFLADSETSTSDRAAEIGFAARVPADVFSGFDYVALGHIHGPQQITENARYCGTPMPYSFGKEEKQTKGVVVLDTETMEQRFVPVKVLHKRTTLECTLDEALNPSCDEETKQGYVRLRISDSYVGLEALSQLRLVYAHPIDVEGKRFEGEDSTISLSVQQLEEMETNPLAVFGYFCREEMKMEPDEHLTGLFLSAVEEAEKEGEQ